MHRRYDFFPCLCASGIIREQIITVLRPFIRRWCSPGARAGSGTPLSRRRGTRTRSPRRSFGRAGARGYGWPCPQRGRGRATGENPHIKWQLPWPIASEKRTRTEKNVTRYTLRTHIRMRKLVGNMQHATWLWLHPRGRSIPLVIGRGLAVEARGALFPSWDQLPLPDLAVHARRSYSDRHAQAQRRRQRPQCDPTDDGSSVRIIGVHEDQGGPDLSTFVEKELSRQHCARLWGATLSSDSRRRPLCTLAFG